MLCCWIRDAIRRHFLSVRGNMFRFGHGNHHSLDLLCFSDFVNLVRVVSIHISMISTAGVRKKSAELEQGIFSIIDDQGQNLVPREL